MASPIDRVLARCREPPAGDRLATNHRPLGRRALRRTPEDRARRTASSEHASRSRPMGRPWPRGMASTDGRVSGYGASSDGTLLWRFKSRKSTARLPPGVFARRKGPGRDGAWRPARALRRRDREGTGLIPDVRLANGPLAFSPDGKTLAATGDQQVLHFWDLATGKDRLATPEAHRAPSPPSHSSTTARRSSPAATTGPSGSGTWRRADQRNAVPHDGWVRSLSVSADGSLLATGSSYPGWGKVHVWISRPASGFTPGRSRPLNGLSSEV